MLKIKNVAKRLSRHPSVSSSSSLSPQEVGISLSLLPLDILQLVFSFLTIKAVGRMGKVCSSFHRIAESPNLWKSLLARNYGKVGVVSLAKHAQETSIRKKVGSFFVDSKNHSVPTPRESNSRRPYTDAQGDLILPPFEDNTLPINTHSSYWKSTIKNGSPPSGLTNPEEWDYKELCKYCIDYPSITDALKHIPINGKCRILLREGKYKENLRIDFPVEIIGIGNVNKIILENGEPQHVVVVDTKEGKHARAPTVIKNITVTQKAAKKSLDPTELNSPHFCVLLRSGDIFLENCILKSDSCSTVCVQHTKGLVVIRGNSISGKSAGISVFRCRPDLTIDGNSIHDTQCSGIEIRPGTNPLVVRNKISKSHSAGIFVFSTPANNEPHGMIVKNEIFENELSGVDISSHAHPTLKHNNIHHGKGLGIYIHEGGAGTISKNEIHHNAKCNVFLQQSGQPILRENKIHSSGVGFSAVGEQAMGELIGNEIFDHENEGVGVLYGANPLVKNNKIHNNKKAGVVVCHNGKGLYQVNEIYGNEGGAFHVQQRNSPMLTSNHVHDNEVVADDIQGCLERNECTFNVTGYTFRQQGWFYCDTCAPGKDLGCCASCAKVCHEGHQLSTERFSPFFCDCASEWGNCRSVKKELVRHTSH